jgi:hypothetical protein
MSSYNQEMGERALFTTPPMIIEALGQTWYFTPDVFRELGFNRMDPEPTLKSIIMTHGSMKGFEEGVYFGDILGVPLRFTVQDNTIIVDEPYN